MAPYKKIKNECYEIQKRESSQIYEIMKGVLGEVPFQICFKEWQKRENTVESDEK